MYMEDENNNLKTSYSFANMIFILLLAIIIKVIGITPGAIIEFVHISATSIF